MFVVVVGLLSEGGELEVEKCPAIWEKRGVEILWVGFGGASVRVTTEYAAVSRCRCRF